VPGGSGVEFSNCTPSGADPTCATGLCAVDVEDSAVQQCLYPCLQDEDCGESCKRVASSTVIEGISAGSKSSCFK
jgi:hypothetical protein